MAVVYCINTSLIDNNRLAPYACPTSIKTQTRISARLPSHPDRCSNQLLSESSKREAGVVTGRAESTQVRPFYSAATAYKLDMIYFCC